jgi:regulator of sirC expression with transglutaminase-like and TPR domain
MPRRIVAAPMAALVLCGLGCAGGARQVYTPEALRKELLSLGPALPVDDVEVPFELPPEALATARRLVRDARTDDQRVEILVQAMFDPAAYGLTYDSSATTTGAETLRTGRGNCVGLASVFIGLARSVGLEALYVDASGVVHETRYGDDGSTINFGHITAQVATGPNKIGLDFTQLGRYRRYEVLDDLEAVAHFFNNRGYEAVDRARELGQVPDWGEAERLFRLAVVVKPTFARGWNNLGISVSRQGRNVEAASHYRKAASLDPLIAAPHANLGALLLQSGDLPAALEELNVAAALDPKGAHIQYNLAVARLRSGDRGGAMEALQRTLSLYPSFPGAQALMEQLKGK